MKSFNYFSLIILAALAILACKTKKEVTAKTQALKDCGDSLMVSIERTPCFGACPIYKLEVFKSGYALYNARNFTPVKGLYYAYVEIEKITSVIKRAKETGYLQMNDEYRNPRIVDFPSTITSVCIDGTRKRIFSMHEEPPRQLIDFENYIDSLFVDTRWIKIRDSE